MHIPVLLEETLSALAIQRDSTVIDATLGSGGHARAILSYLGSGGMLLGLDADPTAVQKAEEELNPGDVSLRLACANFRDIETLAVKFGASEPNAILADLGWRTEQVEESGKGFSFMRDEPLVMTYGDPKTYAFTAHDIINSWREPDIANVLYGYGEESYARKLARVIVEERKKSPIETTKELAELIQKTVSKGRGRIHPATKTFQALRIAVNDELPSLKKFLSGSIAILAPKGRLAVITFHSIEDRIVKHAFRGFETERRGAVVGKKPIVPTEDEVRENPRARSAKLRVFEACERLK